MLCSNPDPPGYVQEKYQVNVKRVFWRDDLGMVSTVKDCQCEDKQHYALSTYVHYHQSFDLHSKLKCFAEGNSFRPFTSILQSKP